MLLHTLGIRYERLLMLSAPITLACVLLAFLGSALETQNDYKRAACYDDAAKAVQLRESDLDHLWLKRTVVAGKLYATEYTGELANEYLKLHYQCYELIKPYKDYGAPIEPRKLIELLRSKAKLTRDESDRKPVKSYGIEIPDKATVSLLGTSVKIQMMRLTQILQFVLAPTLILWLGSLYNTRYRETRLIESAGTIAELYPHSTNIYLTGFVPPLRRRSWTVYYVKKFMHVIPATVRMCVLSIFIFPPVLAYCASLYFLGSMDNAIQSAVVGLVVLTFAAFNMFSELNPWHSGKIFPGPRHYENR